jgi:hypothetical protein
MENPRGIQGPSKHHQLLSANTELFNLLQECLTGPETKKEAVGNGTTASRC